jgi:hypothetical protein
MTTIRLYLLACLILTLTCCGSTFADDWDPNDDSFDPTIKSVVIGDRSWIGDPSPFVHAGLSRTGYTHVNATNFEGFPPAVQISLMVPLKAGESKPPAGGMLMFDQMQAKTFAEVLENKIKASQAEDSKPATTKPVKVTTSLEQAHWTLEVVTNKEQRFLEFKHKQNDKTEGYRFSVNASKKLLGAFRHSLKSLETQSNK